MGSWVRICLDKARVQSRVPLTFMLKKRVNSAMSTLAMSAGACTPICQVDIESAHFFMAEQNDKKDSVSFAFFYPLAPPFSKRSSEQTCPLTPALLTP